MNSLNNIEIDPITAFVAIMAVTVLIMQLLLCFKAKKTLVKLIPSVLLVTSTIVFSILSACIGGWDGIGLLFFALFSIGLLVMSGIGWGLWAIAKKKNK